MINQFWKKFLPIGITFLLVFSLVSPSLASAASEGSKEVISASSLDSLYKDANQISSWAKDHVREATDKGFVNGSNGKVNPKHNITRAEFAKLMVSVLGLDVETSKSVSFTDVKENDWFYPYVNAAYKEKIVSGYSDNTFLPNKQISREEMATMIVRVLNIDGKHGSAQITDINKVSPWAQSAVKAIVSEDLMQGYNNQFKPKDLATREMSIVVAMRAYHYDGKLDGNDPSENTEVALEVNKLIKDNARFMQEMIPDPTVGTMAGDWTVFGLARSSENIPSSYIEKYYSNVVTEIKKLMPAKDGKPEGRLDRNKGTEHSRVILGLTSIGKGIHDVGGYDLTEALADFDYVTRQGINGPIFALIAFDSGKYDIPVVQGIKNQTSREALIDFILNREIAGGGWALGVNPPEADADVTAMAIQGLTPYYENRSDVKAAIDRGIAWLSNAQGTEGEFYNGGSPNSESAAQVVVALSGIGIDAHTDPRFIKNGHSALQSLMSFSAKNGGFYHIKAGGTSNGGAQPGMIDPMATDQAMYALVAYERFLNKKPRLYDMNNR